MKIFVTGATGFVGRHLVKELSKEHQIVCLCRKPNKYLEDLGCKIVTGDIKDKIDIGDSQIVFHLAAIIRDDIQKSKLFEVNVDGTKKIVQECKKKNARLIYLSSTAAVGESKYSPIDEKHTYNPQDNYGISKMESEKIIQNSDIEYVILRPPVVYGNSKVWIKTIKMIKKGFPIIGDGKNRFHSIYVKNLIESCILSVRKGSGIYFIADPKPYTFNEFYETISQTVGINKRPKHVPKLVGFIAAWILLVISKITGKKAIITKNNIRRITNDRVISIEKAKRELGYVGRYTLKESIKDVVEDIKAQGAL